jgi:hypothetical protein
MLQALSKNSETATTVANWPFMTFSVKVGALLSKMTGKILPDRSDVPVNIHHG